LKLPRVLRGRAGRLLVKRAVPLPSVLAVIAAAFAVFASSTILLFMIAAITFAPMRPDDAAVQRSHCEKKKCRCDSAC
jgi:hypothetical protein